MLRDPIEQTPQYQKAMKIIQPILDKEFNQNNVMLGTCHSYWHRKKELLKSYNINWQTPAEMNPNILFD